MLCVAGFRLIGSGRIRDESSVHALKIKEVDTRIESEIAGLRSTIAVGTLDHHVHSQLTLLSDCTVQRPAVLGRCRLGCGSSFAGILANVQVML